MNVGMAVQQIVTARSCVWYDVYPGFRTAGAGAGGGAGSLMVCEGDVDDPALS